MRNQRDEASNVPFAATNFVEDYDFDCNTATTADDAFATYLRDLGAKGQLNVTVTA